MGFKFNPITGELDLVNKTSSDASTTTVEVPAGQTVTVDSVLYTSLKAINYFMYLYKSDFTQVRALKMTVIKLNSSVSDSVYSRVGNNIDCEVVSDVIGPNATIAVTNNEAFDITCSFNKDIIN